MFGSATLEKNAKGRMDLIAAMYGVTDEAMVDLRKRMVEGIKGYYGGYSGKKCPPLPNEDLAEKGEI